MFIYILIIILFILVSFAKKLLSTNTICNLFFIVLFVIVGFRDYSVGADTAHYMVRYENGLYIMDYDTMEIGYLLLMRLCNKFGLSPRFFLCLVSFFPLVPCYLFIKKYSIQPIISYYLYFTLGLFVFSLSGIRQTFAMGIIYLGLYFSFQQKKLLHQILFIAFSSYLAHFFHYSALIGFLYIPLLFIKLFNKRNINLLIVAPVLTIILGDLVLSIAASSFITDRYEDYLYDTHNINIIAYFFIPYLLFLYSLFISRFESLNKIDTFFLGASFIMALLAGASLTIHQATRFVYYFMLPVMVYIPNHAIYHKNDLYRLIYWFFLVICMAFFFISLGPMVREYKFGFLN